MENNTTENNPCNGGVNVYDHVNGKDAVVEDFIWGDQDWRQYHCNRTIEFVEEEGYIMDNNGRYVPIDVVNQMLINASEESESVVYQNRVISYGDFSWEKLHRYSEV